MRIAVALLIALYLIGPCLIRPALAQTPGMNIPLGEEKTLTDEEKEKKAERERDYKSTIGKIPDQKPADPWGNIRSNDTQTKKKP
jgi:hypothetical protein